MSYFNAFIEVLVDLGIFIVSTVSRTEAPSDTSKIPVAPLRLLSGNHNALALPKATAQAGHEVSEKSLTVEEARTADALPANTTPEGFTHPTTHAEAYVVVHEASVYAEPLVAFDSVIGRLPYGSLVTVHGHDGRFSSITTGNKKGWVYKDALVFRKEAMFPEFIVGMVYDSYHETTTSVRTLLNDEFSAAELYMPLQSVEYVAYQLYLVRRALPWGSVRPRLPGTWQVLLKGHPGMVASTIPRTGAVMEYVTDAGAWHVAYTELVRPDGVIVVAGVGKEKDGQFLREEVTQKEYSLWEPVWLLAG